MVDYESDRLLDEYLLFHYGSEAEQLPWPGGPREALHFPLRVVEETFDRQRLPPQARALEVGCAVGRSSFELSRYCGEVIGIDASHRFIEAAKRLSEGESVAYRRWESGASPLPAEARLPAGCHPERVRFEAGDAEDLREGLGAFDLVLACNLLCRLRSPQSFLRQLSRLVAEGGQLVLTTPHTWLESITEEAGWLQRDGEDAPSLAVLEADLAPHFKLVKSFNMPFLLREHRRKYQWGVSEATVWRRCHPTR